jgi:hypothetical protein
VSNWSAKAGVPTSNTNNPTPLPEITFMATVLDKQGLTPTPGFMRKNAAEQSASLS